MEETKFNILKTRGLPGGPNEQFTYITGVFSTEGYKSDSPDVNNPFNIIDSGNITMEGVDFPVMGTDNLGNSQMMQPGMNYQFPGDQVFEVPMAQTGIEVPKRQGVRDNGDGSVSTHLMATETLDGINWVSFPTLFQDPDGTWIDMSTKPWKEAYKEAERRGEIIDFGTDKESAIKFGEGSWKPKAQYGGSLPKAQTGLIKNIAKKAAPYMDDAASYIRNLFSKQGDEAIEEVVEETPNAMSFFSGTPKQLNRPPAEDYIFYRNTSNPETIMKPLDFENPRVYSSWKAPENLSFFTPSNSAFRDYGAEKWGAKINPKKPFIEQKARTYSVEDIQKLIKEGFDAIITQDYGKTDIRDAYQIIPLDKNIISNLEKMKKMGGRVMQDGGEPTFKYAIPGYDQKQFLKEWSNSPMGQKLLLESLGGNEKALEKLTKKRTGNLDTVSIDMDKDVEGLGRYKSNDHSILMNPKTNDFNQVGNDYDSVLLHELSHSQDYTPGSQFNKSTIPLSDQKLIRNLSKDSIKNSEDRKTKKENRYLADPTETRARLNVVRDTYEKFKEEDMPSVFNSEFTPSMLEEVKGTSQFEELQQIFSDEEIIQLLNTVAYQKGNKDFKGYAQLGGGIGNLIKKAGPKVMKYLDNLFSKTDNVVKSAPAVTKQKGIYEMLPIKKLDYPTHYGTVDIDDGTITNVLDAMKAQGKYADDMGYSIDDLVGSDIQYLGDISGRTIVNVPLPNGKSQLFYKSSGLAGKRGSGVGGTSEGLWQPYGGHAAVRGFPGHGYVENWFIKDAGYADYYGSESFKNIANKLDEVATEQGWDMSNQILKSNKKQLGGPVLKKLIKKGAIYIDDVLKRFTDDAGEFASEIDWAKWNKEIPDNTALMQEYATIEKVGKAKGTWMKNPDGSKFTGTPEQWVQQRSSNYIKAFGDSKLINPDGSPMVVYHGSPKKFDAFDESMFQLGDSGYSGSGIYTTPSKVTADSYSISGKRFHDGEIEPTIYELYGRGNNPITSQQLIDNSGGDIGFGKVGELIDKNLPTSLFNFHRKGTPRIDQLLDYDVAIKNQSRGISDIRPIQDAWEIVFPTNKQLKSSIGNNGMFDMSNPNIYKQNGGEYDPYMDIDSTAQKRRTELTNAINKVVDSQGGDKNLRALLTMTAFMENSLGANPDAYGRDYTRGAMSIDDIAYKNMFEKRKGARDYTTSQKKYFDWFEGLGFDLENMDKHLRENVLANVAAARYQYGNAPAALPSKDDAEAMYKYYMDFYNRTDADHKDRFMKGYDAFIKQREKGGDVEMIDLYKKYLTGGDTSKQGQKVYDKLNRLFYNDAKQSGMSPQNYIMTYLAGNS